MSRKAFRYRLYPSRPQARLLDATFITIAWRSLRRRMMSGARRLANTINCGV
jgi:hypothetical protein